ncbi:4'-phosphopantetheinyl transferase superfamily protein [Paenibacillus sp. LMG 31459]|uniref:4'-phosphopantetheinyl transferase superfamily protein n=1 Tax=Paenibacillus phytohabitans TaxID=2654978 RepID=A0ABX1YGE7_9BACL|nr:4'-phosphopantetheinyl transferase superfamily protein [Paenibacillus phytohabitans]
MKVNCSLGGAPIIYVCKLDIELEEEIFWTSLSRVDAVKRERILRYYRREDAWRSLLADLLLRTVLHDQFHLKENELVFKIDTYGKPYLYKREDINFNLTHSGEWIGCAVGTAPVGIDIEQIRPNNLEVAERFFHPEEYKVIQMLPQNKRLDYFYELWTLKEGYSKALGKGLSLAFDSFAVVTSDGTQQLSQHEQALGYRCRTYTLEEGYKMAACSLGGVLPDQLCFADLTQVLDGRLSLC